MTAQPPVDPIAYAWAQLNRTPLPDAVAATNQQRAGTANGSLSRGPCGPALKVKP